MASNESFYQIMANVVLNRSHAQPREIIHVWLPWQWQSRIDQNSKKNQHFSDKINILINISIIVILPL